MVYPAGIALVTVLLWVTTTWHRPAPSPALARADTAITHAVADEAEAKVHATSLDRTVARAHAKTQVAHHIASGLRDSLPPLDAATHDELASIVRVQDTLIRTQAAEIAVRIEQHFADSAVILAADARADAEHAKSVVLDHQARPRCGAKCGAVVAFGIVALTAFALHAAP